MSLSTSSVSTQSCFSIASQEALDSNNYFKKASSKKVDGFQHLSPKSETNQPSSSYFNPLVGELVSAAATTAATVFCGPLGFISSCSGYLAGKIAAYEIFKKNEKRKEAAITIQKLWRGYLIRKRIEQDGKSQTLSGFLFTQFFTKYANYPIDELPLPKAPSGRIKVLLSESPPLVIKWTDSQGIDRLKKMKNAREICIRNNLNKLIIPTAKLFHILTFEKRLPIINSSKLQIGLYIEHRDEFTPAVMQLATFFCHAEIDDLISDHAYGGFFPFDGLFRGEMPCYENLPLFASKKYGGYCLGLIDTEMLYITNVNQYNFTPRMTTLLRFFPLHMDEIIKVFQKFLKFTDEEVEKIKKTYASKRDTTLKGFENIYINHRAFLLKKKIGFENPLHIEITTEARRKITCLYTLKTFDLVINFISEKLKENLKKAKKISSIEQLVDLRSILFDKKDLGYLKLVEEIVTISKKTSLEAEKIIHSVLQTLFHEKVICYYSPCLGIYEQQCIFC